MNTQVSYFTHYQVNEKKKMTPGFNVLCHKFYNSWVSSIIKVKDKRFSSDCRPYQIEQSYMGQVLRSRKFPLFRVGFTKYIEHLCYSEQEYRVEHFKYIMCLMLCRTFYSISSSLYKKKTCSTPIMLNRVKQFCYLSRLYRVEHFCFSEYFRQLNINLRVKNF